ncbi:unnamed protein product [Clavelina lepadiformis]|uniref:Uncharacterized protein n=1 Tax=Clavelina lepadiformis TaxID=159417 RepID=A0ABP0G3X8_CLALP
MWPQATISCKTGNYLRAAQNPVAGRMLPAPDLDEIFANFEIQGPAQLGTDNHGIKDGRRMYKGQKYKKCPKRKQASTEITDEQNPPTTTSQISELVKENKSAHNAERSRPTAGNPPKESSKRDFNESTI